MKSENKNNKQDKVDSSSIQVGKNWNMKKKSLKCNRTMTNTDRKDQRATELLMTNIIAIITTVSPMIIRRCPLPEPGTAAKGTPNLKKKQLWLL